MRTYVVSGNEQIDIAPLNSMTETVPYNSEIEGALGARISGNYSSIVDTWVRFKAIF